MKSGITLQALAAEIERRANLKKDMLAPTTNMVMHAQDSGIVDLRIGDDDYMVNGVAHDQIGDHTGIPAKYYDRMLKDHPDLLATNVNEWFNKYPAVRMARTLDGVARAFLSDSYRPLENEDLARAVLPVLYEKQLSVMSCEITDKRMYIKAVDQKVQREIEQKGGHFGDGKHNIVRVVAPAITISNSEVGKGALSVLAGVYDGFCTNLATFGERSARKYHVGSKHDMGEEVYAILSNETRRKTDAALWAQIGDVCRAAFDRAAFDSLCDKIDATTTQRIDGDPVKVIKLASNKFDMTEGEGSDILKHLIEGGDLSRFGLYNAITRTAQDIESYDRATEFERIGAKVIELPRAEWQTMAEAA